MVNNLIYYQLHYLQIVRKHNNKVNINICVHPTPSLKLYLFLQKLNIWDMLSKKWLKFLSPATLAHHSSTSLFGENTFRKFYEMLLGNNCYVITHKIWIWIQITQSI